MPGLSSKVRSETFAGGEGHRDGTQRRADEGTEPIDYEAPRVLEVADIEAKLTPVGPCPDHERVSAASTTWVAGSRRVVGMAERVRVRRLSEEGRELQWIVRRGGGRGSDKDLSG